MSWISRPSFKTNLIPYIFYDLAIILLSKNMYQFVNHNSCDMKVFGRKKRHWIKHAFSWWSKCSQKVVANFRKWIDDLARLDFVLWYQNQCFRRRTLCETWKNKYLFYIRILNIFIHNLETHKKCVYKTPFIYQNWIGRKRMRISCYVWFEELLSILNLSQNEFVSLFLIFNIFFRWSSHEPETS